MATTEISIKANLTQLRKELALIPNITDKEAKAMSQELIKQLKKSEKAAKQAATGSKAAWKGYGQQVDKTTSSVHDFTEASGDADSTLMGFSAVLTMINPALGEMATVTADVLAGTEALGKSIKFSNPMFIALAVAAAALGGAYVFLKGDEDAAREAAEKHREERERLSTLFMKHTERVEQLALKNSVLRGETTALASALKLASISTTTVSAELAENVKINDEVSASYEKMRIATKNFTVLGVEDVKVRTKLNNTLTVTTRNIEILTKQQDIERGYLMANITLEHQSKEAKSASAKATKDKTNALKDEALAMVGVFEAAQLLAKGDVIGMMQDELFVKQAELRDKSNALTAQQILDLSQLELQIQTDLLDNKLSVQKAVDEQIADSAKDAADDRVQAAIETANQEIAQAERVAAAKDHAIGLVSGLETQASEWSAKLAEEGSQQNLEAARKAFEISKAAALSQVVIDTALMVSKIGGQTGIFAAPLIVGALALGASQMAMIGSEQPSFHAGGLIGHGGALNPDERNITARAGEGVVSQSGMARLGADGLDALNRGTGGGGQIIVTQQYQHRAFGAMVQRDIQLPNSPLRKALRGTGRVGHKSRSK